MTKRWWTRLTAFFTLAVAWRLLAPTVADPDLWGHVLFGQRILSLGLEREDTFSFLTAGHPWINHEWLSEVVFGALYNAGGARALIALKVLVGLLTVTVIYRHLIRRGCDPVRAGLLIFPGAFIMAWGFGPVRPQIFTFLFFALTVIVVVQAETRSVRQLWWLPPLMAVWINFHGGVLAGTGVLGVWGAARVAHAAASGDRQSALRAVKVPLAVGIACAVGLLLNPYGVRLPAFLLQTATGARPDIVEWRSLLIVSLPGAIYLGLTAFAALTILRSDAPRRPALIAVLITLVLLPLVAVRHLPLFAIGLPILIADDFASAWRRRTPWPRTSSREAAVVVLATLAVGFAMIGLGGRDARCIRIDPARAIGYPVRAVEWLSRTGARGNMATFFDWGEYVIWHLAPDIRVSMDGRRETVYPDSIYQEYLRFQSGTEGWRDLLERPETDLVLFSKDWPTYQLLLLDPEWSEVYDDSIAGVFVRAHRKPAADMGAIALSGAPISGAGQCVP